MADPLKILIADDQESAGVLYSLMLASYNCEVTTLTDANLVIDKIKEIKPDLVITDHFMPNISGLEIVETLRKDMELKKTPVLFISGKDIDESLQKKTKIMNLEFLAKPFGFKDFILAIERTLRQPLLEK